MPIRCGLYMNKKAIERKGEGKNDALQFKTLKHVISSEESGQAHWGDSKRNKCKLAMTRNLLNRNPNSALKSKTGNN